MVVTDTGKKGLWLFFDNFVFATPFVTIKLFAAKTANLHYSKVGAIVLTF